MQRKGKKKDGGKGWRKSGVSEGTLRSGVSREINSRSSSFVNFVAVRGLYYLVFPVRSASLYDSQGGDGREKERERREIKRKSGGRLLGRFLKGRKLCIANKRIGHGETPLREVICEFQGEIRRMSLRSPLLLFGVLFLARVTAHYKSPSGGIWRRRSELSVEKRARRELFTR